MERVLVIAGSKSDARIVEKVTSTLDALGITYRTEYASAHREPDRVREVVMASPAEVIVAVAGLAAALPGFVASLTDRPVIGVPVSAALGGLDALLSIAQMPKGVPVATVGIDNGQNAAHLAARILTLTGTVQPTTPPRSYAEAGVDEGAVQAGLSVLAEYVRRSFTENRVVEDFGHYANMVQVRDDLCIAMSTDGVGSKMLVAEMAGDYSTVGIDCVAMNVNDLICVGADPTGFVDYLAVETPPPEDVLRQIGEGLLRGCREAGIPVLGGETAVLPEMIRGTRPGRGIDLAGTAVGVVSPDEVIDGRDIAEGDIIVGIPSNGLHSNGFTLARKVLLSQYALDDRLPWGRTVAEEMLRPTRIYVEHFRRLKRAGVRVNGIAHITGGGLRKVLRLGPWRYVLNARLRVPEVFTLIAEVADIPDEEMFTTFNMGTGLIMVVPEDDISSAVRTLEGLGEVHVLGHVEAPDDGPAVVVEERGVVIE